MKSSLRVIALIHAKPGREAELRQMLLGLVTPTRGEAGCIRYELHVRPERPSEFAFIEEWRDAAALQAHLGSAHARAAFARVPELVEGAPDIRTYEQIA